MPSKSKETVLVVVHGVGATTPGKMLRDLCGALAGPTQWELIPNLKDPTAEPGKDALQQYNYPKLTPSDGRLYTAAYELYWADLKPGGDTLGARLVRPLHVLLALSQIGGKGWGDKKLVVNGPILCGRILHWFLWGCALWLPAIYFPLFHMTVLPPWVNLIGAIVSIVLAWVVALALHNLDRAAFVSFILIPVVGLLFSFVGAMDLVSTSRSAEITAWILTFIYTAVVLLTICALGELTVKVWKVRAHLRLSLCLVRFAALTLPFTFLGGALGALSWAFNLGLSAGLGSGNLTEWDRAYTSALRFDLALIEFAFAAATFAFGAVLVAAFGVFVVRLRFGYLKDPPSPEHLKDRPTDIGPSLRNSIVPALVVLVVGNTLVAALYMTNVMFFPRDDILQFQVMRYLHDRFIVFGESFTGQTGAAVSAFAIYAASSTRIVSFIPSWIGKLRQAAAITADVVLWLAPKGPASYRSSAQLRLISLLHHIKKTSQSDIHVLAHSQGTVIAWDALKEFKNEPEPRNVMLITAGSPIDTLYKEFLGFEMPKPTSVKKWRNFYRRSDYVGGPVAAAEDSIVEEEYRMNHLNYFQSAAIVKQIVGAKAGVEQSSVAKA